MAPFSSTSLLKEDSSCSAWLEKQTPNSVIYVSLGSLATMDNKELNRATRNRNCRLLEPKFTNFSSRWDLSVWCYICHAFLDAQVILPLQPIYETAYALKFGQAPTPQTAEYLHQGDTVDCDKSEFDTEDSTDDVGNADVAPTKNPPNNCSVTALWEGHSVNESYVDFLSLIKKAHPETFEHCSFKTPSLYTSALNMLGEFYTLFASSRVDEMTVNDIGRFRDMFSDLELLRFNVGWLCERLDRIEELRVNGGLLREYEELLDCVMVKERELAEVKILCAAKEMVLRAMFGFLGEKDSTRCAADGLLPGLSQRT